MKKLKHLITIVLILFLSLSNPKHSVAASFQGLGDIPGKGFNSEASDISGDGIFVVGRSLGRNGSEAFIWNASDGMQGLGDLSGGIFSSVALKISDNGLKVIGSSYSDEGYESFIWDRDKNFEKLSNVVGEKIVATDISSDGSTIVGYRYIKDRRIEAVFWQNEIGVKTLEILSDFDLKSFQSKAMSVTENGKIIVGFMYDKNHRQAFIWNKDSGIQDIGDLPGGVIDSHARAVSADGNTIVGKSASANSFDEAFIWNKEQGIKELGDLPGASFRSYANAVSKDGSIVVGRSSSSSYNQAFIWDRENGIQNIKSVLTNKYQLDLEGWTLINATAISNDGLAIVGWGNNPNGDIEAWIAKLDS